MKTRLQLQGELGKVVGAHHHYKGVADTFVRMAREEGILSLQKGLTPGIIYQVTERGRGRAREGGGEGTCNLYLPPAKE